MTLIKLIRKYLLITMLAVLVIGCISHFFIFRYFMHYSTDALLLDQQKRIENYVARRDTLSLAWELVLEPARIEKRQIYNPEQYPATMFKDTMLYSEETGSLTPYRQLYFVVSYKNEHQLVNINQPTMESNDLLYAIASSLFVLVVLFGLFTYVIGYMLKKNVWNRLNKNLRRLKAYDLKAKTNLELKEMGILEFDQITEVIMRMVRKINQDYENSRIFTEDASHEMQTPLSIIKSKLELLMQDDELTARPEQAQAFAAMLRAVERLARLNRSLLLISKINNNQYQKVETVDVYLLIESYLGDLEELIEAKGLSLEKNMQACSVQMDSTLSEILISNLLSNSIRHNISGGFIKVRLEPTFVEISNSCKEVVSPDNLFTRMTKYSSSSDSSGLGLNIVKSVCDQNNFTIGYSYPQDNEFCIRVAFSQS